MRAKERQLAALKKGAAPVPANLPERAEGDARDHAAKAVGVGGKLIDQAAWSSSLKRCVSSQGTKDDTCRREPGRAVQKALQLIDEARNEHPCADLYSPGRHQLHLHPATAAFSNCAASL